MYIPYFGLCTNEKENNFMFVNFENFVLANVLCVLSFEQYYTE